MYSIDVMKDSVITNSSWQGMRLSFSYQNLVKLPLKCNRVRHAIHASTITASISSTNV
jgi:hypothetical protein